MKKAFWPKMMVVYILLFALVTTAVILADKTVTTFSLSSVLTDRSCIVIDAGHGGEDGGATSCTGVLESTINLKIALRLEDLLHLLGWNTQMIRREDVAIHTQGNTIAQRKISDLKNRVKIVNETENAILVSIHQNLFADSRYYGAQVFYAPTDESGTLAKLLQAELVSKLNSQSTRKAKRSTGVYLMEHIQCTGILVECGFLSNPEEERRLISPEYQNKLSCVIAATLCNYLTDTAPCT